MLVQVVKTQCVSLQLLIDYNKIKETVYKIYLL